MTAHLSYGNKGDCPIEEGGLRLIIPKNGRQRKNKGENVLEVPKWPDHDPCWRSFIRSHVGLVV